MSLTAKSYCSREEGEEGGELERTVTQNSEFSRDGRDLAQYTTVRNFEGLEGGVLMDYLDHRSS